MAAEISPHRAAQGQSSIVLLLSLNLILLAFFILLNALSQFEQDKARVVLDSINKAFNGDITSPQSGSTYKASLGALPETEDLVNEVGSLFQSITPATSTKRTQRATVLRIDMPATTLVKPGQTGLKPSRKSLIRRLARALMRGTMAGLVLDLEIQHGVPPFLAPPGLATPGPATPGLATLGQTPEIPLAVRRTETLARRLHAQGLPPEVLSLATLPARPETLRFVLTVRDGARGSNLPQRWAE